MKTAGNQSIDKVLQQFQVMQAMLTALPKQIEETLQEQLSDIIESFIDYLKEFEYNKIKQLQDLRSNLEDLSLIVRALEFDLEATKRERDEYKSRLD